MPGDAARVVIDTNVLLSLFVFADSRFAPLRARLESGEWLALGNVPCLSEFRRVLGYPMFSLDAAAQSAAYEAYAALVSEVRAPEGERAPLPQCKDRDDQKFLELARDGSASLLVTSDKALLKLARRQKLRGRFAILTPEAALSDGSAGLAPGPGEEGVEQGVRKQP